MKVTITLDNELMNRVDDYAEKNYMSRSGFLSLCATQYLNNAQAVEAVKTLALTMSKIADSNKVDEETKKELDDFTRLANMLYSGVNSNK